MERREPTAATMCAECRAGHGPNQYHALLCPHRGSSMQADRQDARSAAQRHRTWLRCGPLFVFTDDGYSTGERILFVTFRLPRFSRV